MNWQKTTSLAAEVIEKWCLPKRQDKKGSQELKSGWPGTLLFLLPFGRLEAALGNRCAAERVQLQVAAEPVILWQVRIDLHVRKLACPDSPNHLHLLLRKSHLNRSYANCEGHLTTRPPSTQCVAPLLSSVGQTTLVLTTHKAQLVVAR